MRSFSENPIFLDFFSEKSAGSATGVELGLLKNLSVSRILGICFKLEMSLLVHGLRAMCFKVVRLSDAKPEDGGTDVALLLPFTMTVLGATRPMGGEESCSGVPIDKARRCSFLPCLPKPEGGGGMTTAKPCRNMVGD